jgi:hypothetical protein
VKTYPALHEKEIPRSTIIKLFAALSVAAFLLRIFYAGHLFQDDGLWFTTAEEILRGKALYKEIYFDKPPVLPLLYALLFKLFGAHILTIRLFTIFYSLACGLALYRFSAFLYDRRTGLLVAAMAVVFSTTYTTGHFQGLNTDFLMLFPYTLGAYWFVRWALDAGISTSSRWRLALASGVAVGVAFQINPKALFNLLFFVLGYWFLVKRSQESEEPAIAKQGRGTSDESSSNADSLTNDEAQSTKHKAQNPPTKLPAAYCLLSTAAGFLFGALPFWLYLAANGSLSEYRISVWDWGVRYARYRSFGESLWTALAQSLGYLVLNDILLVALIFVAAKSFKRWRAGDKRPPTGENVDGLKPATVGGSASQRGFQSDVLLLLWLAVSYLGLTVGGRFYGHYFFQILPSLCLIGGRGLREILDGLRGLGKHRRWPRRAVFALLILGFMFTLARFHVRTAVLAADWLRGTKSELTREWFHERLNTEERLAAATVKEMLDDEEASADVEKEVENLSPEALRDNSPRQRPRQSREDYLFVWGYRPEVYYWSGLLPASRFLSSQPLTGVPADAHYFGDSYVAVLDDKTTAANRLELLRDLQAAPPKFIVDELGFFNNDLGMEKYPEFQEFLADYKYDGARGRFLIYRWRLPKEKNK